MVYEFSVVNFIHYMVDNKIPTIWVNIRCSLILLPYTIMQRGRIYWCKWSLEMFSVVSEFSFVRSLYSSIYHKHHVGTSEWVNRERFRTQLQSIELDQLDHTSCAEENDSSFHRPTSNLRLSLSGNSQATTSGELGMLQNTSIELLNHSIRECLCMFVHPIFWK